MSLVIPPRGEDLSRAAWDEFHAFVIAYVNLLVARWEASDRRLCASAAVVPIAKLRDRGVPDYILVWMLYQGHVECVHQAGNGDSGSPKAARRAAVLPSPSSSFALTELGEAFATRFLDNVLAPPDETAFEAAWDLLLLGKLVPYFDKDDRIFSWGRHVLKCFHQPSVNQELVLCTAEELGWISWFDDPLPRRGGRKSKVCLHDTIKDLNRHQQAPFIHFKGDGTGSRIGWEYW